MRSLPGTRFASLCPEPFIGMHYCGYGPHGAALAMVVDAGLVIAATADDVSAELLELPGHPYFMLSMFQPQIGALAGNPVHQLLREFVRSVR